jgi:hypothetical protein
LRERLEVAPTRRRLRLLEVRVRVFEGDASGLGEHERLAASLKKRMAEAGLQRPELDAEGRLGELQVPGGAGEAALMGDGAEIAQVVVVEEGHVMVL